MRWTNFALEREVYVAKMEAPMLTFSKTVALALSGWNAGAGGSVMFTTNKALKVVSPHWVLTLIEAFPLLVPVMLRPVTFAAPAGVVPASERCDGSTATR